MKTKTYARLSLLLPLLFWGICLLLLAILSTFTVNESPGLEGLIGFLSFYVIGIIFWLLPYILVAVILFCLTFLWKRRTLLIAFVLSPIAMMLLTLALVNILTFSPWQDTLSSPTVANFQDLMSFNLFIIALALIWGYISVAVGFGLYKLLQHLRVIREEAIPEAQPTLLSSLE